MLRKDGEIVLVSLFENFRVQLFIEFLVLINEFFCVSDVNFFALEAQEKFNLIPKFKV